MTDASDLQWSIKNGDLDQVKVEAEQWRALNATHVSINTMGAGLTGVDAHVEVLARVATALEL